MIGTHQNKRRTPTCASGLVTLRWRRGIFALIGLGLFLGMGCRGKDAGGGVAKTTDPLMGGPQARIPAQNLPIPGTGTAGTRGRSDPLLGAPTGRPGDKVGAGYSNDPERWKGIYIPDSASTPASLAGRMAPDDEGLKIEPAGGVVRQPATASPAASIPPTREQLPDSIVRELQNYGVKPGDYQLASKAGVGYVFQADIAINGDGAKRRYTDTAPTPTEAARKVLESVKADRR